MFIFSVTRDPTCMGRHIVDIYWSALFPLVPNHANAEAQAFTDFVLFCLRSILGRGFPSSHTRCAPLLAGISTWKVLCILVWNAPDQVSCIERPICSKVLVAAVHVCFAWVQFRGLFRFNKQFLDSSCIPRIQRLYCQAMYVV